MMSATLVKDTNFNMRMNKQKKTSLEELYGNLGMTLAEAVNILFEKSTIIKNAFESKLIESFIKDNDKTKKDLNPVLLFKATVDGDNSQTFHKKCDLLGATLTIVQNEQGNIWWIYFYLLGSKNR